MLPCSSGFIQSIIILKTAMHKKLWFVINPITVDPYFYWFCICKFVHLLKWLGDSQSQSSCALMVIRRHAQSGKKFHIRLKCSHLKPDRWLLVSAFKLQTSVPFSANYMPQPLHVSAFCWWFCYWKWPPSIVLKCSLVFLCVRWMWRAWHRKYMGR